MHFEGVCRMVVLYNEVWGKDEDVERKDRNGETESSSNIGKLETVNVRY
jgi:hypothetical protein